MTAVPFDSTGFPDLPMSFVGELSPNTRVPVLGTMLRHQRDDQLPGQSCLHSRWVSPIRASAVPSSNGTRIEAGISFTHAMSNPIDGIKGCVPVLIHVCKVTWVAMTK